MDNNVNRGTYKLLELSEKSDSELDLPDFLNVPRKKKIRRKKRPRTPSYNSSNSSCNVWVVTVWITTFLLTAWIITLTWLAIIFHSELQRLDNSLKEVVASNQGVPDQLQKCHTNTKNLRQNQTVMFGQINDLKQHMENLSKEVASVQLELHKIQEKLNSAPEYVNIPQQISEVSDSVANLGSQIKDLYNTMTDLKNYKTRAESLTQILQTNITDLRQSVSHLQNLSAVPVAVNNKNNAEIETILHTVDELKSNVSVMNSTFSNKIQWFIDDQAKDHKTVDLLSESGQNMSARVTTLEGICGKSSSEQIKLKTDFDALSKELTTVSTRVKDISSQLPLLQSQYRQLSNNNTDLQTKVQNLIENSGSDSPSPFTRSLDTTTTKPTERQRRTMPPETTVKPTQIINTKPGILET